MLLTIDHRQVQATEGQTLLEVAKAAGADIPTLCHHEALEPRGACRLCMVEISHPKWPGWTKIVASCVYPAEEGLQVQTSTPEVEETRRCMVDLLLARCPETDAIRALAQRYGIAESSYERRAEDDHCILCGICVRVCQDVIGVSAIGVHGRGAGKGVGTPMGEISDVCIGCGACARSCPTDAISLVDEGNRRIIWDRKFTLEPCKSCGAPTLPEQQINHMVERSGLDRAYFELCDECRRREIAGRFETVMGR